jgi:hypothetical protein
VPLSHGNIGHRDVTFYNANSNLNRFEAGTENPRVGGSIPPLAIIESITSVSCSSGAAFGATKTQPIPLATSDSSVAPRPESVRLAKKCAYVERVI